MKEQLHQDLVKAAYNALRQDGDGTTEPEQEDYTKLVDQFLHWLRSENALIFLAERISNDRDFKDSPSDRKTWSKLAKYHGVNFIKMADAVLEEVIQRAEQSYQEQSNEELEQP